MFEAKAASRARRQEVHLIEDNEAAVFARCSKKLLYGGVVVLLLSQYGDQNVGPAGPRPLVPVHGGVAVNVRSVEITRLGDLVACPPERQCSS